jgi:hypothetical protein
MTGLSVSLTSVSAVARGIAEADSVGNAANAQAATPISNKRFMRELSLDGRFSAARRECRTDRRVPPESSPSEYLAPVRKQRGGQYCSCPRQQLPAKQRIF